MQSNNNKRISITVAVIRESLNFIDSKATLLADMEHRLFASIDEKERNAKKFKGIRLVFYIIGLFVLLLPVTSIFALLTGLSLFWLTPVLALAGAFLLKHNYESKKLPLLNKSVEENIKIATNERDDLVLLIMSSHLQNELEIDGVLRETDDEEFLLDINTDGNPPECQNIIALDYMYHTISQGMSDSFPAAIKHFKDLKEKLESRTDEESVKLLDEIKEGELCAEYRQGVIKRCQILKENMPDI